MSRREDRLVAELQRLAAEFLGLHAGPRSLITVTGCILSNNSQRLQILISVLPETEERAALAFVRRQLSEFILFVHKHLRAGYLPQISFALDAGEKHRQKIDKLLQ